MGQGATPSSRRGARLVSLSKDSLFAEKSHPSCQKNHPEFPSPSAFEWDLYRAQELPKERRDELESLAARCENCQANLSMTQGGFAAFGIDADTLQQRIAEKIEQPQTPKKRSWSKLNYAFSTLAAAAAAVFLLKSGPEYIQSKGELRLRIFRARAEKVLEATEQTRFRKGDRLRFGVNLAPQRQLMILGLSKTQVPTVYYPSVGAKNSAPAQYAEDGALKGAISLDGSQDSETIYLVECPLPFTLDQLDSSSDGLEAPSKCNKTSYTIVREAL